MRAESLRDVLRIKSISFRDQRANPYANNKQANAQYIHSSVDSSYLIHSVNRYMAHPLPNGTDFGLDDPDEYDGLIWCWDNTNGTVVKKVKAKPDLPPAPDPVERRAASTGCSEEDFREETTALASAARFFFDGARPATQERTPDSGSSTTDGSASSGDMEAT